LHSTATDNEEGSFVARKIYDLVSNKNMRYKNFAILYRTNAQSRAMEDALRKMNINYKLFGGLSFYHRREIKDILAYFRLSINHNDEEALLRTINYPKRGIGKTTIEKLIVAANENKTTVWEIISNIEKYNIIGASVANSLKSFSTMIKSFAVKIENETAYDAAAHIAKSSGIIKDLAEQRDDDEGIVRFENLEELLNSIKEFTEQEVDEEGKEILKLSDFMENIALHTDSDDKGKDDGDFVSLMTIHASKGLEFPVVFIVGLEENLFPSLMAINSQADIEEERRLFYVALTRGESYVYLSYSELRYKWGQPTFAEPSRFIYELKAEFVDDYSIDSILNSHQPKKAMNLSKSQTPSNNKPNYAKPKQYQKHPDKKPNPNPAPVGNFKKLSNVRTTKDTNTDNSKIVVGTNVYHNRFGKGKVIEIISSGNDRKATIFFNNAGDKTLLLRFAKLKIL